MTPDGTKTSYGYDTNGIRTTKEVEGKKHTYYYAFGEFIAEEVEGKSIAYIYGTSILGQIQEGVAYTYFTNGQGDRVYL